MSPAADHDAVATQVARLFFDRQLSKVEIGRRLGISRFRVARLLAEARQRGLVRIEYRDVVERDRDLAVELERRFGLDLCVVAAGAEDPRQVTARLAADLVAELIGPDETVGIAWGSTLAALIDHLPSRRQPNLTVVPLAGGSGRLDPDRAPAELARRFAERLGGESIELYAPAFLASTELRDALAAEPDVTAVLDTYQRVTTAVVGIGAWSTGGGAPRSSLVASGTLGTDELVELRERGAVGDLVVHPFDQAGRFVAPELAERALAISLAHLSAIPRVVAVAAGRQKHRAIGGALVGGLVRVLVTDTSAAQAVLTEGVRP